MREISLHILDVATNSIEAGASLIEIQVEEDTGRDLLWFTVKDNGKGMDKEFVKEVTNPFFTSRKSRKVGLGLSLLQAVCERCEGKLIIKSRLGTGTTVEATFRHSHIDRPPLGNIADTILGLILANPAVDFCYVHVYNGRKFYIDTREIKKVLRGVPIDSPDVAIWLRDYLRNGLKDISGGVKE